MPKRIDKAPHGVLGRDGLSGGEESAAQTSTRSTPAVIRR